MQILKKLFFAVIAFVALLLIVALFIPGDIAYERAISINAPVDKVWQNVSSLKAMDKWSPWNDLDPNMKKTWAGTTGTAGEQMCWESPNDQAGRGCQTVTKIDEAARRIDTKMKFLTPYESEGSAFVTLTPESSGTKAVWGFSSIIPYPFRLMKLFMNMEKAIGKDYYKGLERLKNLSEQ